jgi:hypothetical protein
MTNVNQRLKKYKRLKGGGGKGETFNDQEEEINAKSTSNTISTSISYHTKATTTLGVSTETCNNCKGSTPKESCQKGTIV